MPTKVNGHNLMADDEHIKQATRQDLGIKFEFQSDREPNEEENRRLELCKTELDKYLRDNFVMPTTLWAERDMDDTFGANCISCGTVLTGKGGSFCWPADEDLLNRGMGFCGRCGWPCQARHTIKDPEKDGDLLVIYNMVLQYHPNRVGHSKNAAIRVFEVAREKVPTKH